MKDTTKYILIGIGALALAGLGFFGGNALWADLQNLYKKIQNDISTAGGFFTPNGGNNYTNNNNNTSTSQKKLPPSNKGSKYYTSTGGFTSIGLKRFFSNFTSNTTSVYASSGRYYNKQNPITNIITAFQNFYTGYKAPLIGQSLSQQIGDVVSAFGNVSKVGSVGTSLLGTGYTRGPGGRVYRASTPSYAPSYTGSGGSAFANVGTSLISQATQAKTTVNTGNYALTKLLLNTRVG